VPRYTQPRKTWCYTTGFKMKAVKLSLQEGIQVKQVAEGLDIHPLCCRDGERNIVMVSCIGMASGERV
jgi:transposase-like protein